MNLFSFSVEKELSNSFKSFIYKRRPACSIKMALQKILCCGFSINTARKKRGFNVLLNMLNMSLCLHLRLGLINYSSALGHKLYEVKF